MPSSNGRTAVRMNHALNCLPWVRSLTHCPDAVILFPGATMAAWPTTVTSLRRPRALVRCTQKPFSELWKVTRSSSPARTSRSEILACLPVGAGFHDIPAAGAVGRLFAGRARPPVSARSRNLYGKTQETVAVRPPVALLFEDMHCLADPRPACPGTPATTRPSAVRTTRLRRCSATRGTALGRSHGRASADLRRDPAGRRLCRLQAALSKMGQRDLRRLLVTGAMTVVRWAVRRGVTTDPWLAGMLARKPRMLVAVALANRMARIVWALMTKKEVYRAPATA